MARLQTVTVLSAKWQELVERKLTKAISIYSKQNTKLTKKRGGSLTIFAVLTARTLYTYKYEVVVNNGKLHCSPSAFYPGLFILECHLLSGRPGTCPGCTCLVFPRGSHLSGRPADTWSPSGVSCPVMAEDTWPCGRVCRWPARPSLAGFSFRSEFLLLFLSSVLLPCPDDRC